MIVLASVRSKPASITYLWVEEDLLYTEMGYVNSVDWSPRMERWNGALEWSTGMDYWNGALERASTFISSNQLILYHFSFCSLLSGIFELYINFRVYMFLYNY